MPGTARRRTIPRRVTLGVLALLLVLSGMLWARPIHTHAKTLLLLSEVFPQAPVKPLSALTDPPVHRKIQLASQQGTIVADLFLPTPRSGHSGRHTMPAVMLAMGVKTKARDKPLLLNFAQALSRLGYVVLWPRLQALDKGLSMLEQPDTFLVSFRYLKGLDSVASHRIALMGISVGSSVAFVAAADPRINTDVRALVFFGGYHDIVDYLASLATGMSSFNNRTIAWHPSPEALRHVREILHAANARGVAQAVMAAAQVRSLEEAEALLRSAPERELVRLRHVSPSDHIDTFKARIFILHDKGDDFVPYFESAKLNQDLPSTVEKTYLITDLFEHVQPERGISLSTGRDFVRLYGFLYEIIGYV
jgi:fermentation-respiration switch protein FrsA (DUF1100 family)